jgi:predicted transcriptional regulator
MVELLKKIIHKSLGKLCSVQTVNAKCGIYSFWQKGWIEIREMEKKRKNGCDKEYILKVRLEDIVDYFAQERQERSARAKSSFSMQRIPVLT